RLRELAGEWPVGAFDDVSRGREIGNDDEGRAVVRATLALRQLGDRGVRLGIREHAIRASDRDAGEPARLDGFRDVVRSRNCFRLSDDPHRTSTNSTKRRSRVSPRARGADAAGAQGVKPKKVCSFVSSGFFATYTITL